MKTKISIFIQNFLRYRHLLVELVGRDIKIKYRRSTLGVFWTLLNPLLMMAVLSVVFSNLFKFDIENFPLYLLSGQVVFTFFSDATTSAMSAILDNASLIKKIYLPKYIFVISRVLSSTINLFASFTALLLVMVITRAELHYTMILVFIPFIFLVAITMGVGLFIGAITVRFRDIMHFYSIFTTVLMYLTPIIYPMSILPGWIKYVVLINPLTNIVTMVRDVMFYNSLPSLLGILIGFVESVIAMALGLWVFYKNQDTFILNI